MAKIGLNLDCGVTMQPGFCNMSGEIAAGYLAATQTTVPSELIASSLPMTDNNCLRSIRIL